MDREWNWNGNGSDLFNIICYFNYGDILIVDSTTYGIKYSVQAIDHPADNTGIAMIRREFDSSILNDKCHTKHLKKTKKVNGSFLKNL